MNRLL